MNFNWPLILDISQNVAMVGIGAYLATRLPAIRRALAHSDVRLRDQLVLALVFGAFSAFGNWMGIPVMGSMANTRIVGPIAGGLIGGPLVGAGAGFIGAVPRYFMGGYTMWASVIANVIAGVVSGAVYQQFGSRRLELKVALATAVVAELILKGMVLAFSKPFEQAWELEKIIGIPTIIANSLAVGLFVYIVRDVFSEQEKVQAQSANRAIRMIQQTTEFLREGLTEKTALKVACIIQEETRAAAVAITNAENVLAFVGVGAEHHKVGTPIATQVTKQAMQNLRTMIAMNKEAVGCPHPDCRLTAIIDAPILVDGQVLGTLKLCKQNHEIITPYEAEIVQGIADFLGLLIARRQLQEQKIMLTEAEYRMLKAQVNPHFLFNTLGTVRALIRTNPELARICVKDLSTFLRRSLVSGEQLVSLREELEVAYTYIRLEKSRFGDRIQLKQTIADSVLGCLVPVFTLQPLVENAIRHGLSPKIEGGLLSISIWKADHNLLIEVEDNGVGIAAEKLAEITQFSGCGSTSTSGAGIGLTNVHKRLQLMFGTKYGLEMTSRAGLGTIVRAILPGS